MTQADRTRTGTKEKLETLSAEYSALKALKLDLNMQRGQPSDEDLDLSNPMLTILGPEDVVTERGTDVRNYGGGVAGLPEARELFAEVLGVTPDETMVGDSSSLSLMSNVLMWALLRGLRGSERPWGGDAPRMIVTVPGYDRHFTLLKKLGFGLVTVAMTPAGPDLDAVERLAKNPFVKGMFFVPTYSNPTGDTISQENVRRLARMDTGARDFTVFADDAYRVHHLTDQPPEPVNLLEACKAAGCPDRVILFGSTSKITFAGAGLAFLGSSAHNISYLSGLMSAQSIGPNKVEQLRHVKFLRRYPGGVPGLMRDHAKRLKPKFDAVQEVLTRELGGTGLASWSTPQGGYFVSLDTTRPVAERVVALAKEAGVALTPAGATFPDGDPENRNIRLAPSRPPVEEVRQAMAVVALCVKLASAEWDAERRG